MFFSIRFKRPGESEVQISEYRNQFRDNVWRPVGLGDLGLEWRQNDLSVLEVRANRVGYRVVSVRGHNPNYDLARWTPLIASLRASFRTLWNERVAAVNALRITATETRFGMVRLATLSELRAGPDNRVPTVIGLR